MSLASMSADYFERPVRTKGEYLYNSGRVRATSVGHDHFRGQVQGGDLYDLSVAQFQDGLEVCHCDCILFRKIVDLVNISGRLCWRPTAGAL